MTCACRSEGVECDLVDATTMVCRLHDAHWCQVCILDELAHEMARWAAERTRQEPIHELFDYGGES